MDSIKRTSLITLLLITAASGVEARSPRASRVEDLANARQKVSRVADQTKGGPRQRLELQRRRLDRLIGDLESGRSVDPAEIDRALEDAERARP